MGLIRPFDGFPPEALDFLQGLARNNNRPWFEKRRAVYQECLIEPAQAFVENLGMRLLETYPGLDFDPSAGGSGSLIRIYRDIRFSKDKSPYKTWFGIRLWESSSGRKAGPGFYLLLEPSGMSLHTGIWRFSKPQLAVWRRAVDDEPRGSSLQQVIEILARNKTAAVAGQHYARVPRGYDSDHPRAALLRHHGLYTVFPSPLSPKQVQGAGLIALCERRLGKVAALHQWLVQLVQEAAAD